MVDDLLFEPLREYAFMRYGLAVVALTGLTSSVLSCLLVVRRQSMMGDAVAHSVLLGVVVGWLVGQETGIFAGAMAAGLLTGAAITFVERNSRVRFDAALGIVFTFAFALALAIISAIKPKGIDLFHVLLGNVLAVGPQELWTTAVCSVMVLGLLTLFFRGFHFWSFDPVGAHAAGLNTAWFHYAFTAMLAATIVTSIQAVGLVLVIAMLITPGATASLLTERLRPMMGVSAALGVLSSVAGLYGSYHVDLASGPAIVVVASLLFFVVLVLAPRKGLLARWRSGRSLALKDATEDALRVLAAAQAEKEQPLSAYDLALRKHWTLLQVQAITTQLQSLGYLQSSQPVLVLSESGLAAGAQLVRKHRLLESYLHDVQGVPLPDLDMQADRLEHEVSDQAIEHIDKTLGSPRRDPHGHAIPQSIGSEGAILRKPAGNVLWLAEPGCLLRVVSVNDDSEQQLQWLAQQGLLPGIACSVLRRDEDVLALQIEARELTVPRAMAQSVQVVAMRLVGI
jgi:ABC-type Mn2+/Zn2+ transport system permease subunit/Mn-dependent DtxR family transcriptional regulator